MDKQFGTVIFFSNIKSFGFIKPDDGGKDLFCHFTGIEMEGYRTLSAGARVSYEIGENHKGKIAVSVVVIKPE